MISLVLTIKNERQFLPSCLQNLRPLASEIIVVDSGSTDGGPEIARNEGCRVFDFKWIDDFSAARNFSIAQARYDWILWMDPDEGIDSSHFKSVFDLIHRDERAFTFTSRNYTHRRSSEAWRKCEGEFPKWEKNIEGYWEAHSIKLFRNSPEIRFQGRVHETVRYSLPKDYLVPSPEIPIIHHYGNLEEIVEAKKKKSFYLGLAKSEPTESPNYGFAQFCVGRDAAEKGNYSEACVALEIAAQFEPEKTDIHNNLGFVYLQLNRLSQAEKSLERCLQLDPEFSEAWLNRGVIRMQMMNFSEALTMIDRAIATYPLFAAAWRARGQCLAQLRLFDEAEVSFRRAMALRPDLLDAKVDLAMMKLQTDQTHNGIHLLEEALQQNPDEPRAQSLYIQYISEHL